MKIYVMAHKKFNLELPHIYTPLQVGAEIYPEIGYIKDNAGENISFKNENYCELTGLYWIWKNTSDDITGLCHYRRYFSINNKILTEAQIEQVLYHNDMIISKPLFFPYSVFSDYCKHHYGNDLIECGKVINDLFPSYNDAFQLAIQCNLLSPTNMMITRKSILDNYCEWLFHILFELESRINISTYNDYQRRIFGFLAERLLRVWILNHEYKVKEIDIIKKQTI